jgi:hypothetical protein
VTGWILPVLATPGPVPAPAPSAPLLSLDNAFWLSVMVIFLITIISAFIRRRQRDRCMKLFDDYHSTYLSTKSDPIWGDLRVTSSGVEVTFDGAYISRRGLSKTSALVYADELNDALAMCRPASGLSSEELRQRELQLRRSINPNLYRRSIRWIFNAVNTISDAIARTFSMVVGRVARTGGVTTAIKNQQTDVDAFGKTVLEIVGNSYEPLLERHIGAPVVCSIVPPVGGEPIEMPGYLVEYSSRYIALFNTDPDPIEQITVSLDENLERDDFKVSADDLFIRVACTGRESLVLTRMILDGEATDLAVALLPGTRVRIGRPAHAQRIELDLAITRRIDLIIPRSRGVIRYGSAKPLKPRIRWRGLPPQSEP